MAKRRIYEVAKERGMTTQELADRLRANGVEVKSNLSSVEQSDVDRVLQRPARASKTAPAPEAAPPAESAAAPEPAPAAKSAAKPAAAKSPAKPAAASKSAASAKPASAKPASAKPASSKPASAKPASKPTPETTPVTEGEAGQSTATEAAIPVEEKPATPAAEPRRPSARPSGSGREGRPAPVRRPPAEGRPPAAAEGSPPTEGPAAARPGQPPRRPAGPPPRRGRPRLDDMPTVVGPGVPVRKGVEPSATVIRKGEEPPKPEPKPQQPPAAGEGRPGAPAGRPGPRPSGPGAPDRGPRPPRPAGAGPAPAPAGDRGRPSGGPPRRGPAPAPAAGGGGRVRRGDDKPSRRRVVIDSQAGRKSGRTGAGKLKGAAPVLEEERKLKPAPGTEGPVSFPSGATVKDLADLLEVPASEIIKTMMKLGEMVTITQSLPDDVVLILAEELERQIELTRAEDDTVEPEIVDDPADLRERAPVVTIMGHVDHGKTSLLDAVRETEVAKTEAGGITQHIGAYQVHHNDRLVTFIDTPGHEAFTAMRARGAKVTDVAVIVVAANDGVMPQTIEAIDHAKAAEVPIVVAVNKMDLPDANPDRVKQQLSEQGLVPSEWGGETEMVEVSAKQRLNLENLVDLILLVADIQELKANPNAPASGVVVEAQLDVGRGPVATVLIQRGTLRVGDAVQSGEAHGRVKAMFDFKGRPVKEAGPAVPVQILGFNSVPNAGDTAIVVRDERDARQRAEARTARLRMEQQVKGRMGASSLDDFYRRLKEGAVKELALVVKGDVGGSVEALEEALGNVSHPEVKVSVIHSGVGGINESDVMLAAASSAVVIGFNVRPSANAKALAESEGVDIRTYRVIYKALEDVQAALVGMLEPEQVEEELGSAEVRQIFRASRIGTIAGCYVQTGKILRNAKIRVVRDGSIVHEGGGIASLKRFNDDVREVLAGYECGIHLESFDDLHEGDVLEAYEIREVARTQ